MAREENPPFGRGETAGVSGVTDQANWEGQIRVFEDLDYSVQGAKPNRSNRPVKCMCVRNVSAGVLLPGRLGTLKVDGVNILGQVDGYARTTAAPGTVAIDEFLPAAGVAVNDLFWVVIEGPALLKTPIAGADFNGDIAVGQNLVALTAVTSGATTAGRVACQNITGSTQAADYTFLVSQIMNCVGQALSAKTTGNTAADILVNMRRWMF